MIFFKILGIISFTCLVLLVSVLLADSITYNVKAIIRRHKLKNSH